MRIKGDVKMISEMKDIEIQEGVNLHLLKSEKFKTDLIGVYIKRPLKEKEASMNALLTVFKISIVPSASGIILPRLIHIET